MKLLSPFAVLYGVAVHVRNSLYDHSVFPVRKLDWPVVSVGNIRAGGTGKTPFTLLLGELLQQKGIAFDILSRGYGRDEEGAIQLVDPVGSAAEFGDEPILLAQKLGVPVVVGGDRFAAGQFAEKMFSELKPSHGDRWFHVLDDGFQHRQLHRDFDIVLVSPTDAADALLPAGRLREPLSALQRAHAIVLVDDADTDGLPIHSQLIWRARRRVKISNAPSAAYVFCGVARPERFFADLAGLGVKSIGQQVFPDHHSYAENDVRAIARMAKQKGANGFITTEKDVINLKRLPADIVRSLQPLEVLSLELELDDPTQVVAAILRACAVTPQAETIKRP